MMKTDGSVEGNGFKLRYSTLDEQGNNNLPSSKDKINNIFLNSINKFI